MTFAPLLDRPLDRAEDHVGVAAPVGAEHLSDQGLRHATGHADALAVDIASEDRAGAVRAMAVPVAVALAGEVLLHELDAREGRVRRVDAGVEHGHDRARAGERRGIRTDRRDAPCRRRAGGRLRDRFDQARRHRRRHRHHGLVSEQVRAFVVVDLDDVDRRFGRAAHAARLEAAAWTAERIADRAPLQVPQDDVLLHCRPPSDRAAGEDRCRAVRGPRARRGRAATGLGQRAHMCRFDSGRHERSPSMPLRTPAGHGI